MNMKRLLLLWLAGTCSLATAQSDQSYWDQPTWQRHDRGFLWYEPPQPKEKPETKSKPKTPAQMTNKELGAELERLLAKAVESQSTESVKQYLFLQQYAMDRASRFSDVFRRTVWTTPELDYSLRGRPTNAMAISTYDATRDEKRRSSTDSLARTHGIFFYFRGNCPFCHQLAPVLKMYQKAYGVEIFPVSLDGGSLPEFPNPKLDNGSAAKLGVTGVPSIFIANKKTGAIQPIGTGVLSLEEIVNRVYVLTQTTPGQEY